MAPRLPSRVRVPAQVTISTTLALATSTPLGLRPPAAWRGLRVGGGAAVLVASGVAAATTLPAVRTAMAARELPTPAVGWLVLGIPFGTVWSEEIAYRGVLGTVAAHAFGQRWGSVLAAAVFGLSHVADARGAGETVLGTVAVTGVAGWAFGWLQRRSGSLAAPMLAHLAANEAGALAALAIQRKALVQSSVSAAGGSTDPIR